MLQLKVFYNVSFPEGERCEFIFTDQNIQSFQELMEVVRGKIDLEIPPRLQTSSAMTHLWTLYDVLLQYQERRFTG